MSIRKKLYVSYLAMVIVPFLFLISLSLFVLFVVNDGNWRQAFMSANELEYRQALVFGEMDYVLRRDTELYRDKTYLDDVQRRLAGLFAGLVLFQDGKIAAVSPFCRTCPRSRTGTVSSISRPRRLSSGVTGSGWTGRFTIIRTAAREWRCCFAGSTLCRFISFMF
ncbi:hypothetical protein PACILC2_37930 [Paenibacillus cisolokensis]|uniref:Uncharacterized protein n=1 Tax=Paenibacillus cisolokensis TaxID=1658519 RepID=A0ABQ4NAM0_9BACL|nr:hypothetical protein [Paenibacillus cisolokensis]GIQ65225.1 hypothetical protein PACILC2_37930 [Paenibacillus cisolokensis]